MILSFEGTAKGTIKSIKNSPSSSTYPSHRPQAAVCGSPQIFLSPATLNPFVRRPRGPLTLEGGPSVGGHVQLFQKTSWPSFCPIPHFLAIVRAGPNFRHFSCSAWPWTLPSKASVTNGVCRGKVLSLGHPSAGEISFPQQLIVSSRTRFFYNPHCWYRFKIHSRILIRVSQ